MYGGLARKIRCLLPEKQGKAGLVGMGNNAGKYQAVEFPSSIWEMTEVLVWNVTVAAV